MAPANEVEKLEAHEQAAAQGLRNRPERLEWLRQLTFGMFIHWGVDAGLGSVISHSMVGAEKDYLDRFINELPGHFHAPDFDATRWARIARLAGMRYVVFTTKHHSGFCFWDTRTTDFNVVNTPLGRDVCREVADAFRAEGLAVGWYFSPDDFWLLHRQGHHVSRVRHEALPSNNPELMAHNLAQLRELMTQYGTIDFLFFDGEPEGLRDLGWDLNPDVVVTRGALETPEQRLPNTPLPGPWEANFTMGTQWQYKPTHEDYKTGTRLIEMLIETRAKGGNLLLNAGPDPDGRLPFEQERLLREVALWNFVNGEAILGADPWHVTNEGPVWFTRRGDTVYAIVTGDRWYLREERTLLLRSVRATAESDIEVVGQTGEVMEYHPEARPKTRWIQDEQGLRITARRVHRLYNNGKWPNPVVLRITKAEAAG